MIKSLDLPLERKLYFTRQVDQSSIAELTKNIIEINDSDDKLKQLYKIYGFEYTPQPIEIYIDSYGGSVYQCYGLLSVMENSKTPIHTIMTGCAMSCGFMMLISGHKRFAHKLSTALYHQVSSVAWGKLKDMQDDVKETERLQKTLEEITIKKTKISAKRLEKAFKQKQDWFISAEECLKLGIVDEII